MADLMLYICIVLATHLTGHMTLGSRVDHMYDGTIERGPHFKTKVNKKVCEQKCPKGYRLQWNPKQGNLCTCEGLLSNKTVTIDDPPNEKACKSKCPGKYTWSWRSDTGNQCVCVSGKPFPKQASDDETAACIKKCSGSWRWSWNDLQGYVCVCDDAEQDGARKENRSLETKRERRPRQKSVKKKDSSQGSRQGTVRKKDKQQSIRRKEENKSRGHDSKETGAPQGRREITKITDSTYQRGVPQDVIEGTKVNEDLGNDTFSNTYQKSEQQPQDRRDDRKNIALPVSFDSTSFRGVPQDKEQGKKIGEERGPDSKERTGDKVVPDEPSQPDASHEIATQRHRKHKRRERKQDTQESKERKKGVDDGEETNKTEGQSKEELQCSNIGCWWMETQDGSYGCTCVQKRPKVAAKKSRRKNTIKS